jgi:hypothetical protein
MPMKPRAARASSVAFVLAVALAGCAAASDDADQSANDLTAGGASARVDQGWDEATRDRFYHVAQGSELMPMSWFLALEHPTAQGSVVDHLGDFGFVGSDASPKDNPRKLPIGFSEAHDAATASLYGDDDWVGLTCAACHMGQIKINDKPVLIEGGASLIDFFAFQGTVQDAVVKTLADGARFDRFAAKIPGAKSDLRNHVADFARRFGERLARTPEYQKDGKTVHGGPGRLDGLGTPVNETLCKLAELGSPLLRSQIEDPTNCAGGQPANSFPPLWGVTNMEYVQWAGNVHHSLGRNMGEVNGVYGINWVEVGTLGVPRLRTSADVHASHAIEEWLSHLRAPKWQDLANTGLVRPLDPQRVARGESLFAEKCESCHADKPELTPPDSSGYRFWKINVSGLDEVGTDPEALTVNNDRKATLPLLFAIPYTAVFGLGSVPLDHVVSASQYRAFMIGGMMLGNFDAAGIGEPDRTLLSECRDQREQPKVGYKSGNLAGVAFTAPYFHNGSVPTLDDLLQPAAKRPATFFVGCRDYDVERVGYKCDASSERAFLVDTKLPTNSNRGHEFGTDLGDADRAALIEYMKSLESPAAPPFPAGGLCKF